MDTERESLASINLLKLSWPTVKPIKFVYLFWKHLARSFVTINSHHFLLISIENIDSLDHLSRIFLEQEYEILVFIIFQNINQFLSLSAIQLPWKACVCDGICHDFDIWLLLEGVFSVDWNDLGISGKLLTASFSLKGWFASKYVVVLSVLA